MVLVNKADREIVRKPVLHERDVEDGIHYEHPHRGKDVHRTLQNDEKFPPHYFYKLFHLSVSTIMIALIPGRSPAI